MIRKTIVVGPFQCNCTILVCEKTREAIIIDAGDEIDRIRDELQKLNVVVKYSVHTHAHLDHIGAVDGLKKFSPQTAICLHRDDHEIYKNLPMQGKLFGFHYSEPPAVDEFLEHEQTLRFGEHSLSVIHTPGHSPGGICLKFSEGTLAESPFLFSGDTLFRESIGRTDLWGGDHGLLVKSIKQRLFPLPEETNVLPGHGPLTTLAHERRENPFL